MLRSLAARAALLALCALPVAASAQAGSPSTDSVAAIEKGRQGVELFEQGKWTEALARFREAEALYHSPVFLLYGARSLRRAGRLPEAKELLLQLNSETLPASAPPPWLQAQVDGRLELAQLEQELSVADKAPASMAEPPSPAVAPASALSRPGLAPARGPYWPGIAVAGSGGAAIIAGGVVGVLALSKANDDLPPGCQGTRCPESRKPEVELRLDDAGRLARASDVLWISGSVLLVVGVALWAIDPRSDAPVATRVGPNGGELNLRF